MKKNRIFGKDFLEFLGGDKNNCGKIRISKVIKFCGGGRRSLW